MPVVSRRTTLPSTTVGRPHWPSGTAPAHRSQSGHAALAQLGLRPIGPPVRRAVQRLLASPPPALTSTKPFNKSGRCQGQDLDQHAVSAQAFAGQQVRCTALPRHHRRLLRHQVLGQAVGEGGLFEGQRWSLHLQLVGAPQTAEVGAAVQHALKTAVAQ